MVGLIIHKQKCPYFLYLAKIACDLTEPVYALTYFCYHFYKKVCTGYLLHVIFDQESQ